MAYLGLRGHVDPRIGADNRQIYEGVQTPVTPYGYACDPDQLSLASLVLGE